MSRYLELTNYLFSLNRSKQIKTDLSTSFDLAEKLDHPERNFPSVHIAGTNGKGTVAYKMAAVLEENGYRVGLFTSPHLFTYRERIQINRKMISEKEVVDGLEKILPLTKDPKFFEVTTLLAFDYFAENEVDIAIIEAGLGGRLDATNIITPILSIITSIAMDHSSILGETLEEIAEEKSGIIKKGAPVVIGENAEYDPIIKKAHPLYIAKKDGRSIARKGLKLLPFDIQETNGLRLNPPCRYEKHGDIIIDVAHNPSAFIHLFEMVKRDYPRRKIHVLLGMTRDKDIEGSLEVIRKYADRIAFLPAKHPHLTTFENPTSIEEGLSAAKKEGAIAVITGSFYIMKEMQPLLKALRSPEQKEYIHHSDRF